VVFSLLGLFCGWFLIQLFVFNLVSSGEDNVDDRLVDIYHMGQ